MKVCVFLAQGFEESEALVPTDLLRRGGVEVVLTGIKERIVTGGHGIAVRTDALLEEISMDEIDLFFVPGGLGGVANILDDANACDCLRKAVEQDKYIAAICAGPTVLSRLGLINGKKAVCYPGMEDQLVPAEPNPGNRTVQDGKLLTGEAAGSSFDLGLLMLTVLTDKETADKVRLSVHYHG